MKNTVKSRREIARYVGDVWGCSSYQVFDKFGGHVMSPKLRVWLDEYLREDRAMRGYLLHGDDDLAEHCKRRMSDLVRRGH